MINYEKVAEKIFSVIKGHDHDLVMFTEDGMETSSAEEARRFFVSKPNYMVTLDGEARHIKINKNSNVSLEDMESIMKQLKNLATSNMLKTEIRVFGKEIAPKDFAYQAKNLKGTAMENIQEASFSRMHGFKKTSYQTPSYQTLESTKIVVRHRRPIDEEVQGSRARNIQAIFIEHAGERFRFPHNNLAGARAMARHINEGGEMSDSIGKYIIESISNYNKLMEFVRYARTNKLINEESEDIVKTVRESMGIIRREIGQLQGAKTYESIKKRIEESDVNVIEETGEDVSDLQDMFTVRKFDEEIGNVLPIVKKLMDNKQEWRDALVEASEKEIYISEKSDISETDVFEFDSPTQRMGYKVRDIAERMIGESDLQTFVGKVAGKLIEGEQISAFEKKIVGNVLGNAVIREEEELCEGCGEVMESCKCSTKDVLDLISEQFELKMKMVEHEDIFTEAYKPQTKVDCPECGDFSMDLQDSYGDEFFYVCNTCGAEMTDSLSRVQIGEPPAPEDLLPGGRYYEPDEFDEGCDEGDEQLNENLPTHGQQEWWKNDPDDLLAYVYWLRGQLPPDPKEEAWEELKASLSKKHPAPEGIDPMLGDGPLEEADHHSDEVAAGAHSGMPMDDFDVNTTDVSEIADAVIDDLAGDFDDPDMILRAITNLIGSDDPAVDDVYQEVLDRVNFQDDEGQPTEYEEWQDYMGGDDWDFGQYDESIEEGFMDNLAKKAGRGLGSLVGKGMRKIVDKAIAKHIDPVRRGDWPASQMAAKISTQDDVMQLYANWLQFNEGHEDYELVQRIYQMAGGSLDEDFERDRADRDYSSLAGNADCPSCNGTGANTGSKMLTHGWNCPDCKGTGKVMESNPEKAASGRVDPEDFMDDCPDCGGTGKAQDSIFDDDECLKCGGEGYV
jgi:ssDNA-binding Zn-finger/Zn-ribbon topoisomerase 1